MDLAGNYIIHILLYGVVILAPHIHANIDHFARHAQLAHQIFILQQAVFSFKKSFLKIRYLHSPAAREKLDFVSWEIQYLRNTWFSFHIQVFVHFGSIETKDRLSFFGLPKSELQPFFRRIYPSLIVVVFLGSSLFVVLLAFALCFM